MEKEQSDIVVIDIWKISDEITGALIDFLNGILENAYGIKNLDARLIIGLNASSNFLYNIMISIAMQNKVTKSRDKEFYNLIEKTNETFKRMYRHHVGLDNKDRTLH